MAKVTTDKMKIINRSANAERVENAWIDVIPLDGFPAGGFASIAHKIRLMFWKVMDATAEFDYVVDTKRDRGALGSVALKVLELFCRVVRPFGSDYHRVFMRMERALKRYDYDSESFVLDLYAGRGFKEIFPRSALGEGVPLMFEGRLFTAPSDTDAVLRIIYNEDYLTPPPEGERNWHNSEVIQEG